MDKLETIGVHVCVGENSEDRGAEKGCASRVETNEATDR